MKYQVGDDIIVLHSNEEGKVIEIMNDKMVMIEVRGVKFPAYTDQIDFPYFHRFMKKPVVQEKKKPQKQYIDQLPKEKQPQTNIKAAEGVWLSFVPKFAMDEFNDEVVELFKLYLINRTNAGYHFIYKQQFLGRTDFDLKNEVLAQKDFYLHDISFESLNDNPSFVFEFSLLQPDKKKADYFETSVKIKAKQMFQKIEEIKEKNQPTISYPLFTIYPDKAEEDTIELSSLAAKGIKVYDASKVRQNLPPARSVVDLHMEKLSDNWKNMSNVEILGMQLSEFEKWYELAFAHHQPNLIVIHGVGSGRLKEEIHDILKTKKEVKYFVNQYDPRFGYGATEIFFQY
jgi:hypothetical protein